jgi:hypothetical protein
MQSYLNVTDNQANNCFHYLAQNSHHPQSKDMLSYLAVDLSLKEFLNATNSHGQSALHILMNNGPPQLLRLSSSILLSALIRPMNVQRKGKQQRRRPSHLKRRKQHHPETSAHSNKSHEQAESTGATGTSSAPSQEEEPKSTVLSQQCGLFENPFHFQVGGVIASYHST